MLLPIVHYNDPVLRKKGDKITAYDTALARLADDMVETMHLSAGIGLAAQQVGRTIQLCVVDLREAEAEYAWLLDGTKPPKELIMPLALVNPTVTAEPAPTATSEEGCLSFPGIRGDVARPERITAHYRDVQGHAHTLVCTGLLSRCIQHEVDHLNGVLFIDRMDKASLARLQPALKALKKQTREAAAGRKADRQREKRADHT
ncbi:MAG TPA: peptide deformylase [Opitutaceae bacterium]|nr:peptide deformylase [Opitutaceae bacterium]